MKKRILIILTTILILTVTICSLTACAPLSDDDAFDIFKTAYENSLGYNGNQWGNIYYYQEKVKEKAYLKDGESVDGFQHDLSVNVHCALDKKNNYIFDKDYSASVYESYNKETIDKTEKTTMTFIGSNDIYAVSDKDTKEESLFINKKVGSSDAEKFMQSNVKTKDFTSSDWFKPYTLESKLSIFKDLLQNKNNIEFVDTQEVSGGKQTSFMTTKLSFKISQEYFATHPEAKVLDGKYVYVEIVDVDLSSKHDYRISNVYVYKTEKVGGADWLELDYESYILNISYLGPNINPIAPKDYTKQTDIFTNNMINPNFLFKP